MGISVDRTEDLYLTSYDTHTIVRMTSQGEVKQSYVVPEASGPIAFDDDESYMYIPGIQFGTIIAIGV